MYTNESFDYWTAIDNEQTYYEAEQKGITRQVMYWLEIELDHCGYII